MNALIEDQSPAAMARASVTYNMIIEGVLAETATPTTTARSRSTG